MISAGNVTALGVFLEGLLSFFSPCILPLVPLYMTYLSSDTKSINKDGTVSYKSSKVFLATVMFVLGISMTFFILGLSMNWLKAYIEDYQNVIGVIGGTIVIVFGLSQVGIFEIHLKQWHLPIDISFQKAGALKAFLLGFAFSFAWTPCVGPLLTNVLLLAMSQDVVMGNLYILLYALGLIIPFLVLGIFTKWGLEFIKKQQRLFQYVLQIAGVIMLCFGVYMIWQNASQIVAYRHNSTSETVDTKDDYLHLSSFELEDQNGVLHSLKDHEGEYVILNFIASWCQYCKQEIPDFEAFVANENVKAYYVMSPLVNNGDVDGIKQFYSEYGLKSDVLIDEDGKLFQTLGVNSFPMMVVMGPDGTYVGYVGGALSAEQFGEVLKTAVSMYESR